MKTIIIIVISSVILVVTGIYLFSNSDRFKNKYIDISPIIEHSEIPAVDTDDVYRQIHELAQRHTHTIDQGQECTIRGLMFLLQGNRKAAVKASDSLNNYWMPLDKAERDTAKELESMVGLDKPQPVTLTRQLKGN